MKIVSTADLSDRAVITCIQTYNNNKRRRNFQAYQTGGLEQIGIKKEGRKKVKNDSRK